MAPARSPRLPRLGLHERPTCPILFVVQLNITTLEAAERIIRDLLAADNGLFLGDRNRVIYFLLDDGQISPQMAQSLWGGERPPPDTRPRTQQQAISEYGVWMRQQLELAKVVLRNLSETGTPEQVDEQLERYCQQSWAGGHAGGVLRLLVRQLREKSATSSATPREQGSVSWFSNEKDFGFIDRPDATSVFFRGSGFLGENPRILDGGLLVEFDLVDGPRGPEAINIRPLS